MSYLEDCDIAEAFEPTDFSHGVAPHAIDADAARRLWAISAASTHVDTFAKPWPLYLRRRGENPFTCHY